MTLSLRQQESVRAAIRRIVHARIDAAVHLLRKQPNAGAQDRVHEARKQLKQVRALFQLLRPEIGRKRCTRADHRLREVTRSLSPLRDATVLLQTLRQLCRTGALSTTSLSRLQSGLHSRRRKSNPEVIQQQLRTLRKTARQIARWNFSHRGWKALEPGLRRVYRAAREAGVAAATLGAVVGRRGVTRTGNAGQGTAGGDGRNEILHESRKRAKDLRYALEFLQRVQPRTLLPRIRALHRLTDLLGKDHDLAVLETSLGAGLSGSLPSSEVLLLRSAVAYQRSSLQALASRLARNVYAQDEISFVREIHRHWRRWRD